MAVERWTWIYSIHRKEKLIIWCPTGWAGRRRKHKKDLEVNMIPKSSPFRKCPFIKVENRIVRRSVGPVRLIW